MDFEVGWLNNPGHGAPNYTKVWLAQVAGDAHSGGGVGCFSAGFVANGSGSGTRVSLILELVLRKHSNQGGARSTNSVLLRFDSFL